VVKGTALAIKAGTGAAAPGVGFVGQSSQPLRGSSGPRVALCRCGSRTVDSVTNLMAFLWQ